MPDNAQLQIGCQEGELVVTPKWIRVQSPEQQGGWTVLRSAVVEVETTPAAEEHLRDITIRTRNGEWHAHKLDPKQAESVAELLDCSPLALSATLVHTTAAPVSQPPVAAPTTPPDQSPPPPATKTAPASTRLIVACQEGTLLITDEQVSLLGEHTRAIPRSTIAGVTNQPRPGNRAELTLYTKIEGEVQSVLVVSSVAPLDALHVIERLGYLGRAELADEQASHPTATDQAAAPARSTQEPQRRSQPIATRPRVASRRIQQARRRRRIGLTALALGGVCLVALVAGLAFNGINAPAAAPALPVAQTTVTHAQATTVPTRQATAAPKATPVATLNTLAPVPLAFTCATAVSHSYGRVCVHTRPGTALTITVTYCSGFGSAEASSILHGTAYADSSGNYTWSWVPQTDCRQDATVYVTAQSDGQRGYYVYDLPVA